MKKLLLVLGILVVLILGILIKVYSSAVEPIKSAEEKAVNLAKEKVHLSEVTDFHVYHGLKKTVDVIEAKDNKGEKIIIWIPEKSKKITVKKAKSGLTKDEAIQKVLQDVKPKKIVSVRLGMDEDIPAWEVYYRSNHNLLNYYFVDFESGKWLHKVLDF
jgi:uncharacterized protein YpmB